MASIVAAVVVTLGAVWASRARDNADTGPDGVVVPGSPSGQAIGHAQGAVFGSGSSFAGATIITVHQAAPERAGAGLAAGLAAAGEIPREPAAFRDRPDLLDALISPPAGRRVSVVFAVTGLRGVGKSQVAAACARQRLEEGWPVVAWLDAEDRERLLAGYAQLAAALGLAGDAPDSADAALRVRHWLEAGGERCLLVLDNAVSADVLRPFLPAAGHAQVIVTSSRASLAALGVPVPVGVFSDAEAARFLAERTGLADEAGALQVARELGCLPLALAQAGAVIAGQHLDYATYLRRLAGVGVAGYLIRPEEDPYPRGTGEAITLSLHAARQDDTSGLGQQILAVIALLSVREQAAADRSLPAAARDAIRGLQAMLPGADDAWRHPVLMQEYVTQVAALADQLDAAAS